MAQESPSRILYAQAIQLIKKIQQIYSTTKNQTPLETSENVNSVLAKFFSSAGRTMTEFDPIVLSEVPLSSKMNKFWSTLQDDINILQDQVDILNASTIFSHNFIKTEVLKAKRENSRLQNKIKTLEMYSAVDNNSLVYFGDSFLSEELIDWGLVSLSQRATLLSDGHISLRTINDSSALNLNSKITILNGSNGFLGNNQEILDPNTAIINPANGQKVYNFVAEINPSSDVSAILDGAPNTWLEFEKYFIAESARAKAKNLNFEYLFTNDTSVKYLANATNNNGTSISWADGPSDGVLKLYLEIDLGSSQQVNVINLSPYGLTDNINNPIKISKVSTSTNKTDWSILNPENVWIANGINRQISKINSNNIIIGSATWVTDGEVIRYIRFEIEQIQPIDCKIGHIYYVSKDSPAVNTPNYNVEYPVYDPPSLAYDNDLPYDAPVVYGGLSNTPSTDLNGYVNSAVDNTLSQAVVPVDDLNYRVLGPNPPAVNPQLYLDPKNTTTNGLIQKREFFNGKRWVIGVRDIVVNKNVYDSTGIIVSKKFNIPGIVDRVSLEADLSIPSNFDTSIVWMKFYISPDDGATWYQISRIQDDFLGVPEIIAFNDPTPLDLRESGVAYYDVKGTVDSLRVKVEITRPLDNQNATPILHSYKLKVIKRDAR